MAVRDLSPLREQMLSLASSDNGFVLNQLDHKQWDQTAIESAIRYLIKQKKLFNVHTGTGKWLKDQVFFTSYEAGEAYKTKLVKQKKVARDAVKPTETSVDYSKAVYTNGVSMSYDKLSVTKSNVRPGSENFLTIPSRGF